MKRTNAKGITRTLPIKTINCKICGDEQQTQVGSVCHRDGVCVMCANEQVRRPRSKHKKFEVQ